MTKITSYLLQGDSLQCDQGSIPAKLVISNEGKTKIEKKACANAGDNQPTNIPTLFGACSILNGPCAPILAQWSKTKGNVNIKGEKALLKTSELTCTVGGKKTPIRQTS